jgi:hypothetical protein
MLPAPIPAFTLFIDPLPIWQAWWIWPSLLLPLCLAVAIVYKSIKCASMSQMPREAAGIFLWIVLGMAAAAAALVGIVQLVQ